MTVPHTARDELQNLCERLERRKSIRKQREARIRARIKEAVEEDRHATAAKLKEHFERERRLRHEQEKKLKKRIKEAQDEAKAEDERERTEHQERAQEIEARQMRLARRRWLAEGGTEEEFEDEWPRLWRERLRDAALEEESHSIGNVSL